MSLVRKCDNARCKRGRDGGISIDIAPEGEWLVAALGLGSDGVAPTWRDFCSPECAAQASLVERSSEATVSADVVRLPPPKEVPPDPDSEPLTP